MSQAQIVERSGLQQMYPARDSLRRTVEDDPIPQHNLLNWDYARFESRLPRTQGFPRLRCRFGSLVEYPTSLS